MRQSNGFRKATWIKFAVPRHIPVNWVRFLTFENKIYGIDLAVQANWYSRLKDMVVGKYGPPTSQMLTTVQNGAGASFDNIVSEWRFKEGTLTLNQREGTVNTTHLRFAADEVEATIRAATAAKNQAKGRSAL